ncbi:hypothetical protein VC81_02900 [Levilactobacillus spicheri]|uniref:Uncharacterized protein n=1 Tax=Levilactobacillus spicheri TaxID=216463 RepID=A0A0F3RTS9_9LACO|nr:hypothetical protein VC81_02900 [Levilactobacillus spicheri]
MNLKKIGLLAGSLRTDSYAKKVAKNWGLLAPSDCFLEWLSIDQLPLFRETLTPSEQQACQQFRQTVATLDGLCLVTPEINHGMPGCLKNALDIASVSANGSAWREKPALIAGVSTGPMGGISASQDVKRVGLTIGLRVIQPCEFYLGRVQNQLDDHGLFQLEPATQDFWQLGMDRLVQALDGDTPVTDRYTFHTTAQQVTLLADGTIRGRGRIQLMGHQLIIEQIVVDPQSRGRGIGGRLMARLLMMATLFHWQIVPRCSYARGFFERHPEARGVLAAEGVNH